MASTSARYQQILTVRKILLTGDLNVKTGTLTDYVENDYVPLLNIFKDTIILSPTTYHIHKSLFTNIFTWKFF